MSILTQLLQELKTLSAEDRDALREILSVSNGGEKKDDRSPQLPCDHGHVWSDDRRDHNGKRVRRSCTVCGVLALHTGEQHGKMMEKAEEKPAPVLAATGTDSASPQSEEKPKRVRKPR